MGLGADDTAWHPLSLLLHFSHIFHFQVQEAVWASGRTTAPHLTTRVRFRSSAASIKGYLKALRSATLQAEQQADAATAAAVSTTSATSVPQRSAAAPARRSSAVIQVASILYTFHT